MVKFATWNVNSIRARLDHIGRWLTHSAVDVLAVQETKVQDTDFPKEEILGLGYNVLFNGQKSYNGVAVLSREPATEVHTSIPGFDDGQRRVLGVELPTLYLLNLYVPNGSEVGSEKYAYKLEWLDALRAWLVELAQQFEHLVVVGDFNIAPEDRDVHDPDAWRGKVLCSEPERARLVALTNLGFQDTFRRFEQPEASFSWWDYRSGAFRRNHGVRIDLILASPSLADRCSGCVIDSKPRAWDKPSDHAPVIATFEL